MTTQPKKNIDLNYLFKYLEKRFNEMATKEDIKHLPTREQFYKKMDQWMKASSTKDIEAPIHKSRHDKTETRLDRIEKHLGLSTAI